MFMRLANREDPDQIASSEAILSGSALFVKAFLVGNLVQNFMFCLGLFCRQLSSKFYVLSRPFL